MARVFAFATHNVRWQPKPGASLETYVFPAGAVRDVPDDLAKWVTGAHPQKLKLLGEDEAAPDLSGAAPSPDPGQSYADTSMGDSPADRMLSQGPELCGRPKRDGSPCQNVKPCRWHRWVK